MSDEPVTPYGGEHEVVLTGWERRQLAMAVESLIERQVRGVMMVGQLVDKGFPKLEAERQLEWLVTLLRKLVPDEEAGEQRARLLKMLNLSRKA